MEGGSVAIKVTAGARGWTWELIDTDGVTTACGLANTQEDAMEAAWHAVRVSPEAALSEFPNIVLGYD
jgi:hypothetical protein